MGKLEGKVAVVTGGASGIGETTLRLFVEEGARVVVADIKDEQGQALADELAWEKGAAVFQHTDVTNGEQVAAAVARAVSEFGQLDIMHNNAGAMVGRGSLLEMEESEVDRAMGLLFKSVFFGVREAGRVMSKQGKGSIVNTASIAGLNPGAGPHLYATAKAAVVFFTGSAALELGEYDVRVNCVCPGGVATELVSSALGAGADILPAIEESMRGRQAIERPGRTIDIARTVLWLASDESDYVTGQAIAIDGGENYGAKWSQQTMQ